MSEIRCPVCGKIIELTEEFASEHVSVMVLTRRVRHSLPMRPDCVDTLNRIVNKGIA
jgi:hypothetical protein